ncbi:hypothetical protein ACOMHN_007635 [Nucella lapillus]
MDHIATMRIIIEQSLEWQTPLYNIFVDFQKAFGSIDREVIWKLMQHYGFPPKYIAIIQQLYEDATCRVIHEGKLTDPFQVQTGVRQGCLLSPTIFLMVVDWIMRQSTAGQKTGIQWTFTKQLKDLEFADDITYLLSHRQQNAQEKLERVAVKAEKIGLRINIGKTEILRINNQQQDPVRLQQEEIKEVEKFTAAQTTTSRAASAKRDTPSKPYNPSGNLQPSHFTRSGFSIQMSSQSYYTVLKHGTQPKHTGKSCKHSSTGACANILNIRWPEVISNEDLWTRTKQTPIGEDIKKWKWGWIGHTMRKPPSNVTRQALDWNPKEKRKVGRLGEEPRRLK